MTQTLGSAAVLALLAELVLLGLLLVTILVLISVRWVTGLKQEQDSFDRWLHTC